MFPPSVSSPAAVDVPLKDFNPMAMSRAISRKSLPPVLARNDAFRVMALDVSRRLRFCSKAARDGLKGEKRGPNGRLYRVGDDVSAAAPESCPLRN